ncbi:MAG: FAD-binding oxidoreductase [Candidatus Schekmanbacteria bacterium]|nr:FAD-binding oxidoreductase [Candidatus Schekmanbacteria bacterium]
MSSVVAKRLAGTEVTLGPDVLNALRSRLRGALVLAGEGTYEEARTVWNAMIDCKPALVVRCLGVADVVTAVAFAREHSLVLTVKGGGHNISGLATCNGGMQLDMSLMRGVWVDPVARTAHAQAGCLLGDVDRETQIYGLAAVLGFVSATGIAGLTLGGGFGYLTRRFGWTCDNVRSMDVVTAEGRTVRASENENRDLLWALRGGGGNFGVATGFTYALHPVGPEVVAGAIAWPGEHAPEVLAMARSVIEDSPRELTCAVVLRMAPPAPWLPKHIHGKPVVMLALCHSGAMAAGEELLRPIKAFGTPVGDIVQRRAYVSQQCLLDATQPKGRRYYWKSEYLPGLTTELLSKLAEYAGTIVSPHSALILFPIDGALAALPVEHSAVGNRDARVVLNITSSWETAADDEANVEWARAVWRDLRRFSTGGTYVNFLTEEEPAERIRAAYGSNYERLAQLKGRWDPENLFRVNKNIAPHV